MSDSDGKVVVPRLERDALRDHGGAARIDRVWERLEPKLTLGRGTKPQRGGSMIAVAAAAGFALGVGMAGWLWNNDATNETVVMQPAPYERMHETYGAGPEGRSVALPGGVVTVDLEPGAIVTTVSRQGRDLTLSLYRGDATFNKPTTANGTLQLMVDDAMVTIHGRVQVRREGDHAFIQVLEGSAEVASPSEGDRTTMVTLGPKDSRRIRTRVTTARTPDERPQERNAPLTFNDPDETPDESSTEENPDGDKPKEEKVPVWVMKCAGGDDVGAAEALKASPATAAQISDPVLLGCLARGAQHKKDYSTAIAGWTKLANGSDTARALMAVRQLINIYRKLQASSPTDAERNQYAAKVTHYTAKMRQLKLTAAAKGQGEVYEKPEQLCNRIVAEAGIKRWTTVATLSATYKAAYPNGPCIAQIDAILAKIPTDKVEGDKPKTDTTTSTEKPKPDDTPYEGMDD